MSKIGGIEIRFLDSLRFRKKWNRFKKYVEEEFFSNPQTRVLWKALNDLHMSSSKKEITTEWLQDWVDTHASKQSERVSFVLREMRGINLDDDVPLEMFIRRRMIESALSRGIDMLQTPDGLQQIGIVRDIIDAAVRVSHEPKKFYPYFARVGSRTGNVRPGVHPLGFLPRLSRVMDGGAAYGEVCILIGPTGRGKSQFLCNVAADAIIQQKNVLYVTLQDLPAVRVARRVDQILLGWTNNDIMRRPHLFKKKIHAFSERMGKLYIRDFTDQPASFLDLRACVETLKEDGCKVDLLIVDFLDPLAGYTKNQDPQMIFRETIGGLRKLGKQSHFPIWTASQGNRESLDVEEIDMTHIAGPIAKVQSADWVGGMCQTESMKDDGYFVINELKSRMDANLSKIVVTVDKRNFRLMGKGADWNARVRRKDQGVQEHSEAAVRSGGGGDRQSRGELGNARGASEGGRVHAPRHAARRDPADPEHVHQERRRGHRADEVQAASPQAAGSRRGGRG